MQGAITTKHDLGVHHCFLSYVFHSDYHVASNTPSSSVDNTFNTTPHVSPPPSPLVCISPIERIQQIIPPEPTLLPSTKLIMEAMSHVLRPHSTPDILYTYSKLHLKSASPPLLMYNPCHPSLQ